MTKSRRLDAEYEKVMNKKKRDAERYIKHARYGGHLRKNGYFCTGTYVNHIIPAI